jgi:hypothetical protein
LEQQVSLHWDNSNWELLLLYFVDSLSMDWVLRFLGFAEVCSFQICH